MSQLTKAAPVIVGNFPHANREQNALLARNTVASVSDSTETTIVTLAANGVRFITKVMCTGEDRALWSVVVGGSTVVARKRGDGRSVEFDFPMPYRLDASTPMDVKVIQYNGAASENYEASIFGFEET